MSEARLVLIASYEKLKLEEQFAERLYTIAQSAYESARGTKPVVRIELPVSAGFDGTFTLGDAQTYAVLLLDAVCAAFDGVDL